MDRVLHYSFDLWMTLIRSDPRYKQARATLFSEYFNPKKKSLDQVMAEFRFVDLLSNEINETTGLNLDAQELYLMVIKRIGGSKALLSTVELPWLSQRLEELIVDYPPVVYSHETLDVLNNLKEKSGATFSILSNTGFIPGRVLRSLLGRLGIGHLFEFQLYSDEVGMSKPNLALFRKMLGMIPHANWDTSAPDLQKVIHVGDNPHADIFGALRAGIRACLVNSNQVPLSILLQTC